MHRQQLARNAARHGSTRRGVAVIAALALGLAACGGDDGPGPDAEVEAETEVDTGGEAESELETEGEGDGEAAAAGECEVGTYPADDVTIVVGHATGGGADTISRTVAPFLQDKLGVPVVVENVGGAGGMVASQQVYEAEHDGSLIQAMNFPSYILNEVYAGGTPPFQEFEYVYRVTAGDSNGVAVALDSEIQSWEDFLAVAEERTIVNAVASGANNLNNSTPGEALILEHTGIEFEHLPYDSGGEAAQAVIGGHADVTIAALSTLRRLSDEIRTIAYFAEEPMDEFSDAFRFADEFEGAAYDTGLGFIAPPETPAEVLDPLIAAFDCVVDDPAYQEAIAETGVSDPMPGPEFADYIDGVYDQVEELRSSIESVAYLD